MRKQHVLFAALAAAVALSASGCKSREKIDLDTLHTSEAETMASTEASGGDKEKGHVLKQKIRLLTDMVNLQYF